MMVTIRHERPADVAEREALLDVAYGPVRFTKTSERLREGRLPANGLSLVAADGRRAARRQAEWAPVSRPDSALTIESRAPSDGALVGTLRLWDVSAGPNRPALLLGPLAVHPDSRKRGIGSTLVQRALRDAARLGHGAVLLVGDAPYYGRFGFSSEKTGALWLPGPYERHRLLACELRRGALDGARGLISAAGQLEQRPDLAALVAGLVRNSAANDAALGTILAPRAA
jgi:predicted N-acetyltransferase YhbS